MIYLDNAATTRMDTRVLDAMLPYMRDEYGNPESVHAAGRSAKEAVLHAEEQVSEYLLHTGGKGKVIFTSGGTEANNMAFGLAGNVDPLCMNIITSASEHKSVLEPAKSCNWSSLRILKPGRKGYIAAQDLPPNEVPAFTLVSLMHMNNETGTVNEVCKIGETLSGFSDLDVFFHVDCVQSSGEITIDADMMHADLISVSSHKIHGPKGVGCLWVSDRILDRVGERKCLSLIRGGGQQAGFRAGTLNVPGIVGFGKAAEIAGKEIGAVRSRMLSNEFLSALQDACEKYHITFRQNYADLLHHSGKILSLTFPDVDAETVVMAASRNGLCISAGAACNAELSEPSYVLTSSGMSPELARNTVRVSFSRMNTPNECRDGAFILAESVFEVLSLTEALG